MPDEILSPRGPRRLSSRHRLGCADLTAFVTEQCGAPTLCQLNDVSHIQWGRKLDNISEAEVIIPTGAMHQGECCECVARIEPWCHELHVFRSGEYVWSGPVTEVTYGYDKVTIRAQDVLAWTQFRVPELTLDYLTGDNQIIDIAEAILLLAFAEHDPCVTPNIKKFSLGDALQLLPIPCLEQTAFEQLSDLTDGLLDFTVLGRSIYLGGEPITEDGLPHPTPILTDELIFGDIEYVKDGYLAGNRYYTRYDGDDVAAQCAPEVDITAPGAPCKCPAISEVAHGPCTCFDANDVDHCFSPLERLLDLDTGIPANHDTAKQYGDAHLAATRITPRTLDFKDGTRLSPETPLTINDLVPGRRINVILSELCLPVSAVFRLVEMQSSQTNGADEEVTISLQLLDAPPTL